MNIEKAFLKAIGDYSMLHEGDRVLIGASGGKDSLALSWLLSRLARSGRPRIELAALRVSGGGAPAPSEDELDRLRALYGDWGIPLAVVPSPALEGKRDCYRCASLRREALMRYAMAEGCNRIALGHHLDDILTTALMNLVERGGEAGMEALRGYEKFGVTLIRPLAYVPEESIRRLALGQGWDSVTCSCPEGAASARAEFRRRLEVLTGSDLAAKRRLYAGLAGRGFP